MLGKMDRRRFLEASGFALSSVSLGVFDVNAEEKKKVKVRFGMCTDTHYADREPRGNRNYREGIEEMKECVSFMNKSNVDFIIELGDFKDQDEPPDEKKTLKYLKRIEKEFKKFKGPKYHVIGNHDLDSLSKEQFLSVVENTGISEESKYYSFDKKGIHFVVLDANFKSDGSDYDHGNFSWKNPHVPPEELNWLKDDLSATSNPVIVFVHQELSGKEHTMIKNAAEVRRVLEESGKVRAVFQGHNHEGHYGFLNGIHYYTLKPMIEGSGANKNSYATVDVFADLSIKITGYGKATSKLISGK